MNRLINRFLLPILLWVIIAFTHFITSYLDIVKYRPEHVISLIDFTFYLSVYASWALFNIALYSALSKLAPYKSIRYFVYMFLLGLVVWLPVFFILDAYLGIIALDMAFKSVSAIFESLSNQIIFFYAILYALTFGISTAIVYYQYSQQAIVTTLELEKKHSEFELQLANMQMEVLHAQLSPHFLFNCLGSISALARHTDKENVITAIARLGDLLRFTIRASKEKFILLSDEIEFMEHYIALQKLRFADRFTYSCTKNNIDNNLECPPFVLQPLMENAFLHGVLGSNHDIVNIEVYIKKESDYLVFELKNSCNEAGGVSSGFGSALANLTERLKLIYGANYSISHGREEGHYISHISIQVINNE